MDIYEIRKANLLGLMRGRTRAACAERWDTSGSTLSQITSANAVRNLGDRLARKIEAAEGLPPGWMDHIHERKDANPAASNIISLRPGKSAEDEIKFVDTEIVEDGRPLSYDEVELPMYREVEFSAGDGRTQVVENGGHKMRFSLSRLARAGVQPHNAACATANGTSMETTIMNGSPIAIDKGCRHVIDGKIYALDHGGLLRIKRLYRLPNGALRIVSDNSDEYPAEINPMRGPDAPRIIGRVFWWENFD
ncbi:helix-turn-helix transcriptional regulator [Salinicola sp. DM10]|uniref:S24 family peptidase n=1 Tax=Salinicola sp. DM10 TaxID=2815721 RepID=UPI001AC12B18|nr:helix-turn-helix transcriptional regulator [Salinicola sp. DM10]MCE3025759.1 helix-turn-helix transcriptional regulator [Salinicola sp. DM10]